jgi:ethanolamine ammonia-lyase small subunit
MLPIEPESSRSVSTDIRNSTPARLMIGRAGAAYRTSTQLSLREDHAIAVDAVHRDLQLSIDFEPSFIEKWKLFETQTLVSNKREYLLRPDLGRKLCEESKKAIVDKCPSQCDLQIVIADGLSASAVLHQAPQLLPKLVELGEPLGWKIGQPFLVRFARVGVMNDIGDLLQPRVLVMLVGERPGLATAESLSAYMAYRPQPGDTDARRNLISNIHSGGLLIEEAAQRIINLAKQMLEQSSSGVTIKEIFTDNLDSRPQNGNLL